ncbi:MULTISPECIES: COR domain-containing protein [unclassified Microcoleus]|uniref:COR domain-containing protein n=1 Tax=unclassified Microcoleus TaxID=2642155 RepID=UPI002FD1DE21
MTREELLQLIDKAADEDQTELDLAGLGLEELPPEIGKCTQLESLVLVKFDQEKRKWVGNKLTEFPDVVLQLTNLKILNLNNNQITSIPEAIARLSNLTWLSLDNNQITVIPEAIARLSNLTSLSLSSNQITVIPEAIARLSNLTMLNLGGNQITVIPEAIGQLSNLTMLLLHTNQITAIPEAIGQLSNLTVLNLIGNQITLIPEAIGQLSNLTQLYLWNNQITLIPEAIGQLSNLTVLDLIGNQITVIPEAIRGMEKLEKLHLKSNPLPIPPEILQDDLRTILDFYFQTRNPNDTEELYEAKLLIVGEGEAGKTTLAKKLLNSDYKLQEQEPSTEGIDVSRWEFPYNGKTFRVHIWDFGGQEIYHATHQFFLTERSFYILLVDNRRENPNLSYWLSIIELLSSASPVLLVHNEKQDRCCDINVSQLRGDFANLKESLNTNLAHNRGLDELQCYLQKNITQLNHVGIPIPRPWANVRHVLENYARSRNYIDIHEFYDICASQGFDKSDQRTMLSMSKYLHDLGIILHFQKDPDTKKESILQNLVILRPEWATNAVYKVTHNEQVIANYGHFTDENLSEIWSDDEYDYLHDKLLQLMKSFKICYEIGQSGHYIAPQRLPLEPRNYDWDDSDNLIVRYEYEFMPKGIITRLIVEIHGLICRIKSTDIVWRDGVVLTDNYAKAEVIENYHQREIRIRVSGTQKKSLLDKIRHELWKIHATYDKRLKYQEFIPCNCAKCKGSQNPHLYAFDNLRRRLDNRKYTVECEISYENVNVRGLMDDFPDYSRQWEQERLSGIDRFDSVESSRAQQNIYNVHLNMNPEQKTETSAKTNNFNGPMSGVIGSDNAEVNNSQFILNNNANTAEILKLISSMRETAAQFPEDEREEVLTEIDNVEAQLNKPQDKRNMKLIAKKLGVILAIAAGIAGPIANMTDFTNNVTDLAEKANVQIQLPSAR